MERDFFLGCELARQPTLGWPSLVSGASSMCGDQPIRAIAEGTPALTVKTDGTLIRMQT